jgi:DNA-binding PadR family transcriptional regulator
MSLRYAILGLLAREELSGYEITKRFDESVGYFWFAHAQQIYPELARLEREGLVASRLVRQSGRPDKRLYRLTPQGLAALRRWVTTPSPPTLVKDEFLVKVYNYGYAEPAAALAALREHRQRHEERLASYRAIEALFQAEDPIALPDDVFGAYLTLTAGIAMESAFVEWCRNVERILAERAARMPRDDFGTAPAS